MKEETALSIEKGVRASVGCRCEAADARVCWLITRGETSRMTNPRCSCMCHTKPLETA